MTFLRLPAALVAAAVLCAGCSHSRHELKYVSHHSDVMGTRLEYAVYTPPGYSQDERLPLVVMLHGGGDRPEVFERYGTAAYLDREMKAGRIPRAVIVLPRGYNGFWVDWYDRTRLFESWILQEILPRVQDEYGTRKCPEGCHVMGVSMGGFGSIHMAIRHPGRFASVTPISAPVFDTEQMLEFIGDRMVNIFIPTHRIFGPPRPGERVRGHDPFVQLQKPADLHGSSLVLAWGKRDRPGLEDTNRKFIRHLQEHDIPHESWVYDGGHNWKSWTPVIGRALRLQLTSDAPDASAHAAHGN